MNAHSDGFDILLRRYSRKQIVFVAERPRARELKIAYGLRSLGFIVILIYHDEPNFDLNLSFDEVRKFHTVEEALSIAKEYTPIAYHVFSLMADILSVAFVQLKPGIIVFDTNDVFEGMINDLHERHDWQHYCIKNADALCCRDLQIQHVCRNHGYKRPSKLILFQEYCWDNQGPEEVSDVHSFRHQDPHVVLVGNFGIEKRGEKVWGYRDICQQFIKQNIHFHIYLHWFWIKATPEVFQDDLEDYLDLERNSPYFHLHHSVPADKLIQEIKQYDFGINVIRGQIYGEDLGNYTSAHYRYCGSARNMDYLDAGLPVIINPGLAFQYSFLSRNGLAIKATREMLETPRSYLEGFASKNTKNNISTIRSNYSIINQIPRLADFYESLR